MAAKQPEIPQSQFSPPPEIESQSEFSFVDLTSSTRTCLEKEKKTIFEKLSLLPISHFLLCTFLFLGKRKARSVKATVQRREEKRRWRKETRTGNKNHLFCFPCRLIFVLQMSLQRFFPLSTTSAKQIWRFFVHNFFYREARWRVANSFPIRPTQVCFLCEIKKKAKSNKLKRLILFIQGNPFLPKKACEIYAKNLRKQRKLIFCVASKVSL